MASLHVRDVPDDVHRTLARAPVLRYPLAPLLAEAWELRRNVATRDALYVVLARRLRATLVTADARLARAARLAVPIVLASTDPEG